jgi:kinesin family member C1
MASKATAARTGDDEKENTVAGTRRGGGSRIPMVGSGSARDGPLSRTQPNLSRVKSKVAQFISSSSSVAASPARSVTRTTRAKRAAEDEGVASKRGRTATSKDASASRKKADKLDDAMGVHLVASSSAAEANPSSLMGRVYTVMIEGVEEAYGADYEKTMTMFRKCTSTKPGLERHRHIAEQYEKRMGALKNVVTDLLMRRKRMIEAAEALQDELVDRMDDIDREKANLERREARLEAERAELREKVEGLEERLGGSERDCKELRGQLKDALDTMEELDEQCRENEAALSTVREEAEARKGEADTLALRLAEAEKEVEGLSEQLDTLAETLRKERAEAAQTLESAEAQHVLAREALQARLDETERKLEGQLSEANRRASDATSHISSLESTMEGLQASVREAEVKTARLEGDLRFAEEAKASLMERVKSLQEQLEHRDQATSKMIDTMSRSQERAEEREREALKRAEELQGKVTELLTDREELRTNEQRLVSEAREATGREERLQGQLTSAEEGLREAQKQLESARASVHTLEGELSALKRSHQEYVTETTASTKELEEKLEEAMARAATAEESLREREAEVAAINKEMSSLKEDYEASLSMGREATERADSLQRQVTTLKEAMGQTSQQQATALCEVTADRDTLLARVSVMDELRQKLAASEAEAASLRDDVYDLQMRRRALHNKIQDMRGSIRVFVRVRPVLDGDVEDGMTRNDIDTVINCGVDSESLELCANTSRLQKQAVAETNKRPEVRKYKFDAVFGPKSSQEDVFDEVSMFVQSALDGFQVCLFSYGQTGSGKTHTMQGGPGDARGLIPRSVEQILAVTKEMRRQGWEYSLEATFLEIYNESVRDLLSPPSSSSSGGKGLPIHFDTKTGYADVPGLVRNVIHSQKDIFHVLDTAAENRSVASTSMNAVSSRSHSVFSLHIRGENKHKGVVVRGKLNLCDLAGSERLARSQAEGDRLKETQAINKSLSTLADVFTALAKNASHVPFRNSKLTHLLQPCFRGDGKTLMLVSLSPTDASAHESLCSLRFASQVATVQAGKAKKQISASEETEAPDSSASSSSSSSSAAAAADEEATADVPQRTVSSKSAARPTTASGQARKVRTAFGASSSSSSSSSSRRPATARARTGKTM